MREIKFRGKSKETGEWLHGYLIVATGCVNNGRAYICPEVTSVYFNLEDFDIGGFIEVDPDTVGQFTGLKELTPERKEGKEIYEGDIIECLRDGDNPYTVVVVIEDIRKLPKELFGSNLISRKVIGNIYENPELI